MMRVLILATLALSACTPHVTLKEGATINPPGGWVDWCHRNPEDPSC